MKDARTLIFEDHARHISNIRSAIGKRTLGLLLGSGVSQDLKIPGWGELVKAIAKDPQVDGGKLVDKKTLTHTSVTQMLFQHFRKEKLKREFKLSANAHPSHETELIIKALWRELIHRKLYENNPLKEGFYKDHPYLEQLLHLVRKSKITINYNFDNAIEKGLLATNDKSGDSKKEKGFDTTWRSCIQAQPDVPLIYHPNGFLPDNLLEGPSEDLVFSEDSFADQLIDSMAGHYSSVLHHLAQHTFVLLGLSLSDPTLKHLLRQHARLNPGHFHYHIAYRRESTQVNKVREQAIRDANFEVYNLITIFMTNKEIKTLLELISLRDENLVPIAKAAKRERKFVFYITGAPGAGKSTTVANLSALNTFDEWVEERPANLAKEWKHLTDAERENVDKWIAHQFAVRNHRASELKEGIIVLDRTPLDPLSFDRKNGRKRKAKGLKAKMSEYGKCLSGQIILLLDKPENLAMRAKSRHKSGDAGYFDEMQKNLEEIYKGNGVCPISGQGLNMFRIIKSVARIIHFGEYKKFNTQSKLDYYEKH